MFHKAKKVSGPQDMMKRGTMSQKKEPTVPQCIPIARLHFVSLKMLTLSKGFACIGDIIHLYRNQYYFFKLEN